MGNTVINTPELLNLDSTTGATILAKGTVNERPATPTFSVDYLVVAGGGGGGGGVTSESPGAGGAGAVIYQAAGLNVIPSSEYTLYIADGGAGGGNNAQGTNGQDSYISFSGSNVVLAKGGGGGGSNAGPGKNGGSGGGGTRDGDTNSSQAGGSAVTTNIAPTGASIYGNNGATGTGTGGSSGGGGGAGSAGAVSTGGDGVQINIDGNNYYWGGGGGAGGSAGTGGQGGGGGGPRGGQGGTGGINPGASTGSSADGGGNGGANTGGGGGGATNPTGYPGGTGGSGIVILRYPNTQTITIGSGLTGTTATVGSDRVTTFTAGTGTISFLGTVVGGENDATDGTLRFNTETNKTEYSDGTGWYEIVDEYASGFIGPGTNYFDTKLYTGNGAAQSIGGYINGAGSFNGSSSKIVTGLTLPADSSMSFSLWFKTSTAGVQQALFGETDSSFSNLSIRIGLWFSSSNNMYVWIANGSSQWYTTLAGVSYLDGNWHNFVLSIDGTSVKLYADGASTPIIDTTSSVTFGTAGVTPLTIGAPGSAYAGYFWTGDIDQVRIYDTALSSTDAAALNLETATTATTAAFPSGQTAIATYTMDTSANGLLTTTDLSTVDYPSGAGCIALYEMNGNSNDTSNTYNGTPTNITYEGGAFDQAAVFNGSSSWIDTTLKNQYIGSISVWFKGSSGFDFLYSSQNGGSSGRGVALQINTNGTITVIISQGLQSNNALVVATTDTFFDNSWHNAVLTWDLSLSGTNTYLYVDNQIKASGAATTGNWTSGQDSSHNLILGNYTASSTSYVFNGSIDQVRVFNTALTGAQVTTLARGIATSYSGAATNVNFNGQLNFQPDLVWVKNRDESSYHYLYNTVSQGNLYSDSTATQDANSVASYGTISPSTNGFGVTRGSNSSSNGLNKNSNDYVSWSWKAGGTAVTNNDGTITSQVSANKDSGFSIATYTGVGYPNASTAEVGHGLLQAPDLVFIKGIGGTGQSGGAGSWVVGTGALASNNWAGSMYLNSTGAYYTAVNYFWNGAATDSVVKLKNDWFINGTNNQYVMYSWHSVDGFSKIGSYTGTGTTTGNVVTVGFEPRFLLVKSSTYAGTNWIILDKVRTPNNPMENDINPNLANAQQTGTGNNYPQATTTSTTFQCNTTDSSINGGGQTYLYLAIA